MIIDLNLLEHSKEIKSPVLLKEAISNNSLIIVLGAPGSGKTSILKEYADENSSIAQFLKIKNFLKLDNQVDNSTKILLLDGLDEYRSLSNDKTFVITELADKLRTLENIKIVISCRELDWYGDSDQAALKDELGKDAKVFSIQLLNEKKQKKFAHLYKIENSDIGNFIIKFSPYGFLDNPQMFKMIAELYVDSDSIIPSSKSELYKSFIKGAKEKNPERTRNITNQLSGDEILKYSGYLALFYMFSGIDRFDDDTLEQISNSSKGYSKEKLLQTLNTTIYYDKTFIHRTTAEYALAYFLVNEKGTQVSASLANERIKKLFVKKDKIPTELRGVYAWLCSLSQNNSFIEIDPFYQAVYGDNSLFSYMQKQEIVLNVEKYAKDHPYFINFGNMYHQLENLSSLYQSELDDFYIQEFEKAKLQTNHYKYFLVSVLSTTELSNPIKAYLKNKIFDFDIPTNLKYDLLEIFKDDIPFLLEVLEKIKQDELEDNENRLKNFVLTKLYPNHIKPNEIVDYIKIYKKRDQITVGDGLYLYDTKYEEKFKLVKELLQVSNEITSKSDKRYGYIGSDFISSFISDYLYETILKFPKKMNAIEIYNIIDCFKHYVDKYYQFKFEPYRQLSKENKEKHEKEFKVLSNELFSIHIDKAIEKSVTDEKSVQDAIFNYRYFFPYHASETPNILLSKMDPRLPKQVNDDLFTWALTYIPFENTEEIDTSTYYIKAKEFDLEEKLDKRLNPTKEGWKIEQEEYERKQQEEKDEIKRKNEEYFSNRSDEEILSTFGDLKFISDQLYFKEEEVEEIDYLEKDTFGRLKKLLKSLIYHQSIDETLTTIYSLAKVNSRGRNIDDVYYVALALNNSDEISEYLLYEKLELLNYLYIIAIRWGSIVNIIKTDFMDYFEQKYTENSIEILKEFIEVLIKEHFPDLSFMVEKYICNETNLEALKGIAKSSTNNLGTIQEDLLYYILARYAFVLDVDELNIIDKLILDNDKNKTVLKSLLVIQANDKANFDIDKSVALYELISHSNYELYNNAVSSIRVKVIDYMFSIFNTEKSIEFVGGFQSSKSQCASFLRDIVKTLNIGELQELLKTHKEEDDIWRNRILYELDNKMQQDADQRFEKYSIDKMKNFILDDAILSNEDFFTDLCIKLDNIKQEVEDNIYNEKKLFFDSDGKAKNEEYCRDVILQKLNDKYGYDSDNTKEKHKADNRADINIRYKANLEFEVQVECKKDSNNGLYTGIPDQLITKYLSSKVEFGIYLIFYFGYKTNKEKMLAKINASIPNTYENRISVTCIDLTS